MSEPGPYSELVQAELVRALREQQDLVAVLEARYNESNQRLLQAEVQAKAYLRRIIELETELQLITAESTVKPEL